MKTKIAAHNPKGHPTYTLADGSECAMDGRHYKAGQWVKHCPGLPECPAPRLVAAAPELLEAAKAAERYLFAQEGFEDGQQRGNSPAYEALRAAIAKATGKEGR